MGTFGIVAVSRRKCFQDVSDQPTDGWSNADFCFRLTVSSIPEILLAGTTIDIPMVL
jgi:hypothetical protein